MDQEVINTLVTSVQVIMSQNASQQDRLRAHEICEEFKESCPNCITYGLILAGKEYPHIIRHFGLQLLEHCIRYRWTQLADQDKETLKSSSLTLIAQGTEGILDEQPHIKDIISRLVVEIMKHEWPNFWPNLMNDLFQLCLCGPAQKELVLKVFLRLVEDIVIFQNMNHQRRKDLVTALSRFTGEMFEFFINILQDSTQCAEQLLSFGTEEKNIEAQCQLKVSEMTLMTLNGYLDWVSMSHITMKDCILLQMLCLLLSNKYLQYQAAECLYTIVQIKGKLEDRTPILMLFHEGAMSTIWEAAITAEKGSTDEHFYKVLQKLCQILVELGRQLCTLWGNESCPDVGQPPNFEKYLKALLACTQHPSQMLSSYTLSLWSQFIRHKKVSQDPYFKVILPELMESLAKALYKVGYPSQSNSPCCNYARLDFDSDEEFIVFFSRYRCDCADAIRYATLLIPVEAYQMASQRLTMALNKPVVEDSAAVGAGTCQYTSQSFLDWESLTVFLESVMSRLKLENQSQEIIDNGVHLLKTALMYESQDPLLLSNVLSCISALFIFLKYTPTSLSAVLKKIFSLVLFNFPGQTKSTRCKTVKNLRQHACSVLIKISINYPHLVFPVFEELFNHVQQISTDPEQLSQMEKHILVEALIIVSNQFKNYEKQLAFLGEVLKPSKELWSSEEFKIAFWSTDKFMSYIGLDEAPVEPSSADTCGIHRSHIRFCTNDILGAIKRSKWPDDLETAKSGGFVSGMSPSGEYIMKNPATPHVTSMLENVLALLKSMNMLHCTEYIALRHPDFAKSYDLPESEIHTLLGIPSTGLENLHVPEGKQSLKRMKNFLTINYDVCGHILGNAGQCLGHDFYSIPNLAQSLIQTVFCSLDVLPDYRLRSVIRIVLKPIIQHCPVEFYTDLALPLLAHVCTFMYTRLEQQWKIIQQRCEVKREDEDQETQEVLEEQLTRTLTRDYLELLGVVCFRNKSTAIKDEMEEDEDIHPTPQVRELGTLGKLCLKSEAVCEALLLTVFSGLIWVDTAACLKCSAMAWPLLKQLVTDNQLPEAAVNHFYERILMALQTHGHHDASQAALLLLGVQTYELLLPRFPCVRSVMLQIPHSTEQALKAFDEKLLNSQPNIKTIDKKKKDSYKRIVSEIIGKNIGQQFKREIKYRTLPNLFPKRKVTQPSVDEVETKDIGLCELFKPEPAVKNEPGQTINTQSNGHF